MQWNEKNNVLFMGAEVQSNPDICIQLFQVYLIFTGPVIFSEGWFLSQSSRIWVMIYITVCISKNQNQPNKQNWKPPKCLTLKRREWRREQFGKQDKTWVRDWEGRINLVWDMLSLRCLRGIFKKAGMKSWCMGDMGTREKAWTQTRLGEDNNQVAEITFFSDS